jgi:hypothetical protein
MQASQDVFSGYVAFPLLLRIFHALILSILLPF